MDMNMATARNGFLAPGHRRYTGNGAVYFVIRTTYVADIITIIVLRNTFNQMSSNYRSESSCTMDGTPRSLWFGFCSPSRLCRSWKRSSRQASPRLASPLVTRPEATAERHRRQRPFVHATKRWEWVFSSPTHAVMLSTAENHCWVDGAFKSGRRTTPSTKHFSLSC